MTRTHLIIDADVLVYRAALAHQFPAPFEEDPDLLHDWADLGKARDELDRSIESLEERFDAAATTLVLSGLGSWRKEVLPGYKGNRLGRRPLAWRALRGHLLRERNAIMEPDLEGDDVAGIWATAGPVRTYALTPLIWSIDKDFYCVPGWFARDEADPVETSPEDADLFHLRQTLEGDRVDNYPGCPGIGPKKSEAIARGGWPAVVAAYQKAGLGEAEALQNARVAHIMRADDYNFDTQEVTLWTP